MMEHAPCYKQLLVGWFMGELNPEGGARQLVDGQGEMRQTKEWDRNKHDG